MTDKPAPDSVAIVLLPDSTYIKNRAKRSEPHLTIAMYGAASQAKPESLNRLRGVVEKIRDTFRPIKVVANGVGMFAVPDGVAVVDLIDGIGPLNVRALVTQFDGLDGATIDTRHGFCPHMTRKFVSAEDPDFGLTSDDIDNLDFTFNAVGLWAGEQRYELSLK